MKKSNYLSAFVILGVVLLMVFSVSCSKKRGPMDPPDVDLSTKTITATITITSTMPPTATITETVDPLLTATSTPTITQTSAATATITQTAVVRPAGWIDDCDDDDNTNDYGGEGLGGYWITYDDLKNTGCSYVYPWSDPSAEYYGLVKEEFKMTAPGVDPLTGLDDATGFAARITGYVVTNAATTPMPPAKPCVAPFDCAVAALDAEHNATQLGFKWAFVGMGVQLLSTAGEPACDFIDLIGTYPSIITADGGLRFWVKGEGTFSVKIPYTHDTYCDSQNNAQSPVGANEWKYMFSVPEPATWTHATVRFSEMTQASGWGTIVPMAEVLTKVRQIQFQAENQTTHLRADDVPTGGNGLDLWIDDIEIVESGLPVTLLVAP